MSNIEVLGKYGLLACASLVTGGACRIRWVSLGIWLRLYIGLVAEFKIFCLAALLYNISANLMLAFERQSHAHPLSVMLYPLCTTVW